MKRPKMSRREMLAIGKVAARERDAIERRWGRALLDYLGIVEQLAAIKMGLTG